MISNVCGFVPMSESKGIVLITPFQVCDIGCMLECLLMLKLANFYLINRDLENKDIMDGFFQMT